MIKKTYGSPKLPDIEVGAIEVGSVGLNNGRRWRWSVCRSSAGVIEARGTEARILGS